MNQPINILLVGASGAVGSRIDALADSDDRFRIAFRIDRAHPHERAEVLPRQNREIIVDFSHFSAFERSIALARKRGAALLVGTTALPDSSRESIAQLAREVPVLVAPNTSVGCVVLLEMVQKIVDALGKNFSPSIVEWHREGKQDAPSGTAQAFKIEIMKADDQASSVGPRAVASVRAGGIVGEHMIRFDGPDETIEIVHRAHSRDLFAHGALRAAAWLVEQAPGNYGMADALGMRVADQQDRP